MKLNFKSYITIIILVIFNFNVQALPLIDIIGGEEGIWKYDYCGPYNFVTKYCDNGFDTEAEAEQVGIEENFGYQSQGMCAQPFIVTDTLFPDEIYPNISNDPIVGGNPFYDGFHIAQNNERFIQVQYETYNIPENGDPYCTQAIGGLWIEKNRTNGCPDVYSAVSIFGEYGPQLACQKVMDVQADECPANNGGGSGVGASINTATGNEFHLESIDLSIESLPFSYYYSSFTAFQEIGHLPELTLGKGWNHLYAKKITGIFQYNGNDSVMVRRDDGKIVTFTKINNLWENYSHTSDTLTFANNQWVLTNSKSQTEKYNLHGKLISVSNYGNKITLSYEGGDFDDSEVLRLERISLASGQYIDFSYTGTSVKIDSITDNLGRQWSFGISNDGFNNLTSITFPDNTIKEFHYGENNSHANALTGITARHDVNLANPERYITYKYDDDNRVFNEWIHAKDHNGNDIKVEELNIVYNADNTRTITNSRGKVSTYTVEQNSGLWQIKDITGPGCSSCSNDNTSFVYDPVTNDLLEKTSNGKTTKYGSYDSKGQYGYKIEAFGTSEQRQINYTYDPRFFNKPLTVREESVYPRGFKLTSYTYNDDANMTSMTVSGFDVASNSFSHTTTYEYKGPLNQISLIDGPRTDVKDYTIFEYYPNNSAEGNNRSRLKKLTNAMGIVLRDNIQYTATGRIQSEDKPNGITTSYDYYPGNDRLETTTSTDGIKSIVSHMTYLATGEIETLSRNHGTAEASTMTMTYDNARRLTRVTDDLGNYVEYTLDTEGNQEHEKTYDPNGVLKKTISQVFDEYDQVDTSTQSGVTNSFEYGSDGNLYQQTNGNQVVTDYDYDALNRLTQITQDYTTKPVESTANTITTFEYDANDRVNKVTNARGNDTIYEYDDLGRLTKLNSPDTGIDVFSYDAAGNVLSKLDANGNTTTFTYDAANRPLTIDYVGTDLDVTFVYDQNTNGLNQLTSFSDSKSETTMYYDSFGNLINKSQTVWNVGSSNNNVLLPLVYVYDDYNRLESLTYPSGLVVAYHYNNLNQIEKLTTMVNGQNIDVVDNIDYMPMGPIKSMNMGNGLNYTADYDNGYRLNSIQYGNAYSAIYSYDNNHNISNIDSSGTMSLKNYDYDNLDRLTFDSEGNLSYEYDKLGNRTGHTYDTQPEVGYAYSPSSNQLINVGSTADRIYDDNGNTLAIPSENHQWSFSKANRMSSYIKNNSLKAEYTYNGIGQRVYKKKYTAKGSTNNFVYLYNANGQLLSYNYYDASGDLKGSRENIWLGQRPLAQKRTSYANNGSIASNELLYFLSDHLNTPRKLTDDAGTVLASWDSDAFGTTAQNKDVDGDGVPYGFDLRFPGQIYDSESKQHYNYFRDYEPGTGRYLESDPIGLKGGMNTFGYVGGNPMIRSDELGLYYIAKCKKWKFRRYSANMWEDHLGKVYCDKYEKVWVSDVKKEYDCEVECRLKMVRTCSDNVGGWESYFDFGSRVLARKAPGFIGRAINSMASAAGRAIDTYANEEYGSFITNLSPVPDSCYQIYNECAKSCPDCEPK